MFAIFEREKEASKKTAIDVICLFYFLTIFFDFSDFSCFLLQFGALFTVGFGCDGNRLGKNKSVADLIVDLYTRNTDICLCLRLQLDLSTNTSTDPSLEASQIAVIFVLIPVRAPDPFHYSVKVYSL